MTAPNTPLATNRVVCGDALAVLRDMPDGCVNCVVTSPPYFGLRDYGVDGQIGNEETPAEYACRLVEVFREARRVLRDDGTLWLNLGDSYANDTKRGGKTGGKHAKGLHGGTAIGRGRTRTGLPSKSLMGIPWRVAFALQDDGWLLRSDIIWSKPNPMPESVKDRPTRAHEYIFLFTKSERYWYDAEAIKETAVAEKGNRKEFRGGGSYTNNNSFDNSAAVPNRTPGNTTPRKQDGVGKRQYTGFNERWDARDEELDLRNSRTVWTIATAQTPFAHFATFPEELARRCILAGCPQGGLTLDMFGGSGTVGVVARKTLRDYLLIELNPDYAEIARQRIQPRDKKMRVRKTTEAQPALPFDAVLP